MSTLPKHMVLNALEKVGPIPLPNLAWKAYRVSGSIHSPLSKFACMEVDWVYRNYLPPTLVSQMDHIIEP